MIKHIVWRLFSVKRVVGLLRNNHVRLWGRDLSKIRGYFRTVESATYGNRIAIEIIQMVVLSINGKRLPSGRKRCCYSLPYPYSTCTIVRRNYMHILVVTRYRMYRRHS